MSEFTGRVPNPPRQHWLQDDGCVHCGAMPFSDRMDQPCPGPHDPFGGPVQTVAGATASSIKHLVKAIEAQAEQIELLKEKVAEHENRLLAQHNFLLALRKRQTTLEANAMAAELSRLADESLTGKVTWNGGGTIHIEVDRMTEHYAPLGAEVEVRWLK